MHIDFRIHEQIGIQLLVRSCFATMKPIVIPASNALVFPFCLFFRSRIVKPDDCIPLCLLSPKYYVTFYEDVTHLILPILSSQ